mmetsp:Transcript_102220/g.177341  ORF Transcript_102220/g.177341 Transcript_102220/m.177341 type:complete len:107 (+) Transcript_102220:1040-1360(+)
MLAAPTAAVNVTMGASGVGQATNPRDGEVPRLLAAAIQVTASLRPLPQVLETTSLVMLAGPVAAVTVTTGASGVGPAANPRDGEAPTLLAAAILSMGRFVLVMSCI